MFRSLLEETALGLVQFYAALQEICAAQRNNDLSWRTRAILARGSRGCWTARSKKEKAAGMVVEETWKLNGLKHSAANKNEGNRRRFHSMWGARACGRGDGGKKELRSAHSGAAEAGCIASPTAGVGGKWSGGRRRA